MTDTDHQVTLHHNDQVYTFTVPPHQTVLDAALDQGIELPFSCHAGVCTTCAGRIKQGQINQKEAMGVSPDLQAQGYALLCVSYAMSDLEVESGKEDELYELQFGAAQKR